MAIKKILAGLGGTPNSPAVTHHAVELAKAHRAELLGLTVIDVDALADPPPIFAGGSPALSRLMTYSLPLTEKNAERAVKEFERICKGEKTEFKLERHEGRPLDVLVNLSRYADLIVLGLRGLFDYGVVREREDFLLRLMRSGVKPVLATGPQYRPVRRVVVGYNGSVDSAASMKRFVQMGLWTDIEMEILCLEKSAAKAETLLDHAAEYCRSHGLAVQASAAPESSGKQLLEQCERRGADLIVLGSGERSLLSRKALGDVLFHTITHSDIPLFIA